MILNDGSKPADYFVPKEFAKGPDGKDFRKENGNILKNRCEESERTLGESEKRAWKR